MHNEDKEVLSSFGCLLALHKPFVCNNTSPNGVLFIIKASNLILIATFAKTICAELMSTGYKMVGNWISDGWGASAMGYDGLLNTRLT